MHEHGGFCFIDFAASAPYVILICILQISWKQLDAIFFSPHKFLGGPGSAGVLIFNKELYKNDTPDSPGGGTVKWTNRWGGYSYITDIEVKEDGGTPVSFRDKDSACCDPERKNGNKKDARQESELIKLTLGNSLE